MSYKLYYFNFGGRAEQIRFMFHYAGKPFEDIRFEWAQWVEGKADKNKADFKYGQLPVLEIDGKVKLAQSGTIARYLAEKFGLNGKDDNEKAMADELNELHLEFTEKILPYLRAKLGIKPGDVEKLRAELYLPEIQHYMPLFEKALKSAASGYLLPSGICYADFVLAYYAKFLNGLDGEPLKEYKQYQEHTKRVYALPQLQGYLKTLPAGYF